MYLCVLIRDPVTSSTMEDEEFVTSEDENDADGHFLTLSVVVSGLSSAIFDEDNGKVGKRTRSIENASKIAF